MNFNKIVIVGRVGRDPELKVTPSDAKVCSFSLATSRVWKKDGESQEQTEWHNVVFWNKPAEIIAQYVRKGSLLLVEGRVQTRTYEKDGVKMYRTEIIGENFQLPPKSMSGGGDPDEEEKAYDAMGGGEAHSPSSTVQKKVAGAKKGKVDTGIEFPEDDINPDDIPF